ncbi:MAG: TetR/AcrR family transcriptional regulator [Polyangiaceae bacterium]
MNEASLPEAPLSRREEAKALFRNAILDAAERVFAEHGFHVARIQDVAKQARIGVGTVYNHFEQKEDLLLALLEDRTGEVIACLTARPEDPPEFEPRLLARLTRVLEYVDHHRSFFIVASDHGLLGKAANGRNTLACAKEMHQMQRFRAAFRGLVEEGVAEGALEPMDAHRLAWSLGGILRMFMYGALTEGNEPSLVALAPTIVRLFLHGAAPQREAALSSGKPTRAKTTRSRPRRNSR